MILKSVGFKIGWYDDRDVEESGGERISLAYSNCGLEPFSYVVVIVDCTGRLVIEAFCGFDQVGIDVIQPHGCQQCCVLNSVKCLLEVDEDVTYVLLVLQVFLTECSKVENLLCCAPSCSETSLCFDYLLSLWLQSIQEDS